MRTVHIEVKGLLHRLRACEFVHVGVNVVGDECGLDRDGRVSTADARAILRDAISTTPESAAAVRWIFFDQAQNLSPASRSNLPSPAPIVAEASLSADVRLIGILLGDVDGSWTPV